MVWIEICYDGVVGKSNNRAIIGVDEREGTVNFFNYLEGAKVKLFIFLAEKYGIKKNEITIYDYRYLGRIDIIS